VLWDKKANLPSFNKYLCEGCGTCALVCPTKAISLKKVKNATLRIANTSFGFSLVSAQLEVGESGSGKVVSEVRKKAEEIGTNQNADVILIDGAPGIGCPVIASLQGADVVVAVTEPTPSALSDLSRLVALTKHFRIETKLVINRYDLNPQMTESIKQYAEEQNLQIISTIPYDERFIKALVWQDISLLQELSKEYGTEIARFLLD